MFTLVELSDVVRVLPTYFNDERNPRLELEINKKYSNKVIHRVGLCIILHDLLDARDPMIYPGDGAAHIRVRFRMVVFRPFVGEVLQGKIKRCTDHGIFVTMGFFDDIFIPTENFQPNTVFNKTEQLWAWHYAGAELFLDIEEDVLFRVTSDKFYEASPADAAALNGAASAPANPNGPEPPPPILNSPFTLEGTINDFGLGLPQWWG